MCGVTEALIGAIGIASAGMNYVQNEANASYQRTQAKDALEDNRRAAQQAIEDKNKVDTLSLLSQSRDREKIAKDKLDAEKKSMQSKASAYASKYADGMASDIIDTERTRTAAKTIELLNATEQRMDTDYTLDRLGTAQKTASKIASLNDVYTRDNSLYDGLSFALQIGSTGASMLKKEKK